jgi:hypothetical protein
MATRTGFRIDTGTRFHTPNFIQQHLLLQYPRSYTDLALDLKHHNMRIGLAVELTLKWLFTINNVEYTSFEKEYKFDFKAYGVWYDVKAMGWHEVEGGVQVLSQNISASVSQDAEWTRMALREKKPVHVIIAAYTNWKHDEFVILGIIDWSKAITKLAPASNPYDEDRRKLWVESALKFNDANDPLMQLIEHKLGIGI